MKQKSVGEAATWLSIVSLLYASRMETLLAKHDLTFGQFSILNHIARPELSGGTRISEIAAVVALKQPAVTKALAKFVGKGFVVMEPSQQDHRAKRVTVTAKGTAMIERVRHNMTPDLSQVFGHFTSEDLEIFVSLLKELGLWLDKNRDKLIND